MSCSNYWLTRLLSHFPFLSALSQDEAERKRKEIAYAAEEEQRRKIAATQLQKILGDMFLVIKAVADVAAAAKAKGGKKK
jgi:hypothetical protein